MTSDNARGDEPRARSSGGTRTHGPRWLRPWRQFQRWARRSRARDIAVTMLIIGSAFLVLALAMLLMVSI